MNKKGFTLVEILGVIVLLSIIVIIATTSGFSAFNNTKNKLKSEDEKTIIEACKVLMTEVLYCEDDIDVIYKDIDFVSANGITGSNVSCTTLQDKAKNDGLTIKLDYLIDNDWVSGSEIIKLKDNDIEYKGLLNCDENNNCDIVIEGE